MVFFVEFPYDDMVVWKLMDAWKKETVNVSPVF